MLKRDTSQSSGELALMGHRLRDRLSVVRAAVAAETHSRQRTENSRWRGVTVVTFAVLAVTTSALSTYTVHRLSLLERTVYRDSTSVEDRVERVESLVDGESRRRALLVGIRDEILAANRRVSLTDAYAYASLVLDVCDKYPSVDPLLLVSVGIVESGYDPKAVSHADARGLYQVWPSTGRLLARSLNWEYSDDMLFDAAKNTEMAALYLDMLLSVYNDVKMVLAEYNGGPLNAGYLRAESPRVAAETRMYVDKVLLVHRRLTDQLGTNRVLREPHMTYLELGRAGKRLAPGPTDSPAGERQVIGGAPLGRLMPPRSTPGASSTAAKSGLP